MPKGRLKLKIDEKPLLAIGGTPITASASPAPPAVSLPQPPVLTSLTTALYLSAQTPAALINATWTYPGDSALVSSYLVQYDTASGFTAPVGVTANPTSLSAALAPLPVNTLFYVRVATRVGAQSVQSAFSNVLSITTAVDTTAPGPVTSLAATFVGTGDLLITWTNPASANFHWADVRIYASNGGALLRQVQSTTGRFLYTVAMNLQDTGGAGDPTLYLDVRAQSWGAVYSTSVNASANKSAPTAPTISVDFTGPDAIYTITPPSDAATIRFVADTGVTARDLGVVGRCVYALATNRVDHSGTPDPSLAYSFTAIDGLKQASAATTGTATNAAPAAPTATLTQGAVSGLYATVTSTPPADFLQYEFVFKRDGSTVATVYNTGATYRYEFTAAADEGFHSWTVVIRQEDVFLQFSSTVTPSAVAFEALTLAGLRAQARYTDSDGNSSTTLNALKDGITDSGGVSYAA